MRFIFITLSFILYQSVYGQSGSHYNISFDNAVHHEASVEATFKGLTKDTVTFRMSRTSPGRYALHEFAKNVYDVKATDSKGNKLITTRPDPYQWQVIGHDGEIKVSYALFADRADGTYSQIDESHAHLNAPATFMYVPDLAAYPIEISFDVREDLNWKVATQLIQKNETIFTAPNLQYFMDSPIEISDYELKEFKDISNGKEYTIRFVLHHDGTEQQFSTYFDKVNKIVQQEKAVFGEYPDFDHATYTFLACYLPHVSGDGMEHRNSTILTSTKSLDNGGMEKNIGTVAHEFFHAWNVERIRPEDLEPFDFEEANMSEALWFAEGFTSYYTGLILCRAGVISHKEYIEGLSKAFNYVWNSPARRYFNPIEMSHQAPFVDAATSVDPVNRANTFISYYSYGSMLGLALDLSLRNHKKNLNLDDYMKLVWEQYGKIEKPYTVKNLEKALCDYAGDRFGKEFFDNYIYDSKMPDYASLFAAVGVLANGDSKDTFLGLSLTFDEDNRAIIDKYVVKDTPAYKAGLEKGDIILSVDGKTFTNETEWNAILEKHSSDDQISITYQRFGKKAQATLPLEQDPEYTISLSPNIEKQILSNRNSWLEAK